MFPKGTASLLALWTGRASVAVNALGLATLAMLALDPRAVWNRWFLSSAGLARVHAAGLGMAVREAGTHAK